MESDHDSLDYLSDLEEEQHSSRFDELAKREQALLQKNAQINKQTEQVVQEADKLVKHTEEKLNEPIVITKVVTKKPQILVQDLPDDEVDIVAAEMGAEARMKFYKARLKVLEKDMKDLIDELRQKDSKLSTAEKQAKEFGTENAKLKKQNTTLQTKADKQKKDLDDAQEKIKSLLSQVDSLRKEKQPNPSPTPQAKPTKTPDSARLQKTQEELEKCKIQFNDVKRQRKEDEENHKNEVSKLKSDIKLLDRQKQDLILAFKKQQKLIDVLKRQKLHIEAARLMSFTEDEFQALLDLGEKS